MSKATMPNNDQTRLTSLARIRGGLHDMGLTMKSPQTIKWTMKALDRLEVSYSQTDSGSLTYLLPDDALEAMATAIEKKLIDQLQQREAA